MGAPNGKERKFRVVITVDPANADRSVKLIVMVAQCGVAAQILEKDKLGLNKIAEEIATAKSEISK